MEEIAESIASDIENEDSVHFKDSNSKTKGVTSV
jgi:hypothetical protein